MFRNSMIDRLCEEYKNICSLHQGDLCHTKLLTIDIDTRGHLPIAQQLYTLPLKHIQWVQEEKKAQAIEQPQNDCEDYYTWNRILPAVANLILQPRVSLLGNFV